jgi:hypothetical protein
LLLLRLFKVDYVLLSSVGGSSCDGDFGLHHFVVFFNLFDCPVKLIEFFLGLEYSLKLFIGFLLLTFVLLLEDLVLLLSIYSVLLDNVIVVMCPFEGSLHLGKLMLNAIELNTSLFSLLFNFTNFLLLK